MLRAMAGAVLLAASGNADATAAQLRAEAEAQAQRPVRLDERLPVPACPAGFAFRPSGPDAIDATCLETGWRMRIPLVRAQQADAPRRGQALRVEIEKPGYRATVDGIVETSNARDGTVLLRNPRSGSRFTGQIQPDGRILAIHAPLP